MLSGAREASLKVTVFRDWGFLLRGLAGLDFVVVEEDEGGEEDETGGGVDEVSGYVRFGLSESFAGEFLGSTGGGWTSVV